MVKYALCILLLEKRLVYADALLCKLSCLKTVWCHAVNDRGKAIDESRTERKTGFVRPDRRTCTCRGVAERSMRNREGMDYLHVWSN